MKNVDVIGVSSGIIGIVLAVFVVDELCWRIVISLIIVAILLIAKVIIQCIEFRKLNSQYEELQTRHSALTEQYRKKESHLSTMQDYWHYLGYLFISIKQNKQIDRLGSTFDLYAELTSKLNNDFTED